MSDPSPRQGQKGTNTQQNSLNNFATSRESINFGRSPGELSSGISSPASSPSVLQPGRTAQEAEPIINTAPRIDDNNSRRDSPMLVTEDGTRPKRLRSSLGSVKSTESREPSRQRPRHNSSWADIVEAEAPQDPPLPQRRPLDTQSSRHRSQNRMVSLIERLDNLHIPTRRQNPPTVDAIRPGPSHEPANQLPSLNPGNCAEAQAQDLDQ